MSENTREFIWNDLILLQNGERVASLRKKYGFHQNGETADKYEISTQDYMSAWENLYFDTFEEAKRETERVVRDNQLLVHGIVRDAIQLANGNILFLAENAFKS